MPDDTKQRILDAAFLEFAANGKAGARMQAIAERAQINSAMLNYYFRSKDELYDAVLQRGVLQCRHEMEHGPLDTAADPRETFLTLLERHIRFWAEHRESLRLILHDLLIGGQGMQRAFQEMLVHPGSQELFERLTASRCFRTEDPRQLLLHFASATLFCSLQLPVIQQLQPGVQSERELLEGYVAAARDLFAHGLFSDPPTAGAAASSRRDPAARSRS